MITKGWGTLYWGSGCVDVLGYYPIGDEAALASPAAGISDLTQKELNHPYAITGLGNIEKALQGFQSLCHEAGYPLQGDINHNWLLPTALGTLRPTCLTPVTMVEGDTHKPGPMLIVGFDRFYDFFPSLVAANLTAQNIRASGISLDLPSLRGRRSITGMVLTRLFDTAEFRSEILKELQPRLGGAARVGFPAILGLENPIQVKQDLEAH